MDARNVNTGESMTPDNDDGRLGLVATLKRKYSAYKERLARQREQKFRLWGDIGYHRYIGGENYNMVLDLLMVPLGLVLFSVVTELFFPDPSVRGYQDLTKSLMGFFFGVMDIGLGAGQGYMSSNMERFVSEHAQVHPRKALRQIQFFISWQMFTGLIQVTAVGIYCFAVLVHTTLAHMAIFIIAYSFIQYPGILQIFESLFQAYQRYDYHGVVTNLRDGLFSPLVQIACISIGKYIGATIPTIGEVMGITVGFLVSIYLADVVGVFFGGSLFSKKVLKERNYDYGIKDFFRIEYTWADVKEILYFIGPIQIISTALGVFGLITTLWITQWVSAYASWQGLLSFAGTVAGLAIPGGSNKSWSTVSEAYNNGKIHLTHDYIEKILKYHAMRSTRNLLPVMVLLPLVLEKAVMLLDLGNLGQYLAGIVAVPLLAFISSTGNLFGIGDRMLTIATRRNVIIIFSLVSPFLNFFFAWLFLVHLQLGWVAIPLYGFVPNAILSVAKLVYVFRRVLPGFRFTGWWQSIVAPGISALGMGLFGWLVYQVSSTMFFLVDTYQAGTAWEDVAVWGFVLVIAFLLFIGNPIVYQLFYALVGGWDDDSLEEFHKGVLLSGPSAWMVKPIYWVARLVSNHSPLHGRFPIKNQDLVRREIAELEALRDKNLGSTTSKNPGKK